ncbi:MAG: hypothetical protein O9301_15885 [Leptospira sp.]|nr:hypothetical protein [Leptospira sp.]
MLNFRNWIPFYQRIQWQTLTTIWQSLELKEKLPFLYLFFKHRIQLQYSDFWKEWKKHQPASVHLKYPLETIAFYSAFKQVTNSERTVIVVVKILKNQSSEVFLEIVDLFRKFGIPIL